MVDQPPIRQITIKISKPEPPTEPEWEYIIHWDRIIGAFSALIVLIGLLGYGLYAWLKPSTKIQSPVREDPPISVTAQMPVLESGGEEQRVAEQKGPSEAQPNSSASAVPDMPVAVGTKTLLQTESDEAVAASEVAEEKIDKGRFWLPKTTVASPAVKRFLLAQSVINNEPYGVLDDISVNTEGFAVISSFSEVIGLEGEVLQYRWLHEGKEVLRIRVPVRANRWRSHSTKRIYAAMKGTWRAELRDSEGTLLASTDFVF